MIKNTCLYLTVLLTLVNCVTVQQPGTVQRPEFNEKANLEDKKKAYDTYKFTSKGSYAFGMLSPISLRQGESSSYLLIETVKPVLSEMSPEAIKSLNESETLWWIGRGFFAVGWGAALIEYLTMTTDNSGAIIWGTTDTIAFSVMGASIVGTFIFDLLATDKFHGAFKIYNAELSRKLGIASAQNYVPAFTRNEFTMNSNGVARDQYFNVTLASVSF